MFDEIVLLGAYIDTDSYLGIPFELFNKGPCQILIEIGFWRILLKLCEKVAWECLSKVLMGHTLQNIICDLHGIGKNRYAHELHSYLLAYKSN